MENNLLKKGYVMVSRALLQKVCEKQGAACCDEAAFLRVLINVNFKPTVVFCNGVELQCARGESVISFLGWADLFGWTRGRTRNFSKTVAVWDSLRWFRTTVPAISAYPVMTHGQ